MVDKGTGDGHHSIRTSHPSVTGNLWPGRDGPEVDLNLHGGWGAWSDERGSRRVTDGVGLFVVGRKRWSQDCDTIYETVLID